MKPLLVTVLALLFTQHFASAQTLRWTHTPAAPTGIDSTKSTAGTPVTDTAGNLGVVIQFKDIGNNTTGYRILWLSATRGRVLMLVDAPVQNQSEVPSLVQVSGSYLLAQFNGTGTNTTLRRYRYLRGHVTQSDLAIDTATDWLAAEDPNIFVKRDATGFYIFSSTADGLLTAIKRYSIK